MSETDEQRYKRLKAMRGPAKVTNYCLPMHTKVLTKEGWKNYGDIKEGETLPVYNHYSNKVVDGVVEKKHFYKDTEVVTMANSQSSVTCTPNHRWYSARRVNLKGAPAYYVIDYVETEKLRTEDNLILSAPYQPTGNNSEVTPYEAMFMGLVLSDGYFKWSPESEGRSTAGGKKRAVTCMIAQSKNKYCDEVEKCLSNISVDYRKDTKEEANRNDVYKYYLTSASAREFLERVMGCRSNPYDYNWTKWVMSLDRKSLESFYYGFYLGDGDMKGSHVGVSQNEGVIFDAVVATSQLLGWGRVGITGNSKCKYIRLHGTERMTMQKTEVTPSGKEDTFCLTTSHGSFIIWQDGFVGITGNSSLYGVGKVKLAREAGMTVKEADALITAFWDMNWSIKQVAKDAYVRTLKDGSMWVKNPVSGFYYSLRNDRDTWSTLNQGTGVFIVDSWIMHMRRKGVHPQGQIHDEVFFVLPEGNEKETLQVLEDSIAKVNHTLKLNVEIAVDVKFGENYAQVH